MGRRRSAKPRRRGGASRRSRRPTAQQAYRALGLATAAAVALAVAVVAYVLVVYPDRAKDGAGRELSFTLVEGESLTSVAERLADAGVVEQPLLFATYLRLLGADERLRRGDVILRDDHSPRQLARLVATGMGALAKRVTIPEGFHRFAIARRLAERGLADEEAFLRAVEDEALLAECGIDGPTAEGYLFPDTYELRDDMSAADIVRAMVDNFERRFESLASASHGALTRLEEDLGYSRHHIVILASIVEKEAAVDEERALIAGVFLNRLRSQTFRPRHRLQADPTVSYGCLAAPDVPSCEGFRGHISRAMLEDSRNTYNTYRHGGLPPGPIANPGLASLRAVLEPAEHDYLFFVARGNRRHAFSASLDDHNAHVDRFIRGVETSR